ncbi:MAG: porin [Planctomycetaceae bacterium]|nr:porin [Planctomycetaceae bacterium]
MTALPATAEESFRYSISDDVSIDPVSVLGDAPAPGQKDDACGCNTKGEKGSGCSCHLWGPDEPLVLYSGDNNFGISVGGWTQLGYTNKDSYADGFNQNSDNLNLHQQWLWAERVADGSCGWDLGFRADILYGIDANNTQAFGNDPGEWDYLNGFDHGSYGWAIPQLYAELANGDFSVKLGHFYTLIGYEVVTAPDNFFFSHAFTMNNSEPFTHTGAIATYNYSADLTLYGGWTAGWDTGFDQFNGGSNWLGGVGYSVSDDVSFTYMSTYGDFGFIGNGRNDSYSHSVVVDFALTENLNYVFQSDMIRAGTYDTIGINQYLFYTLNDCTAFGTRIEWWKAEGLSVNAATFGLNYRPHANLVLRPEMKHEWVPGANADQTIFGMDAIVTF